MLFTLSPSTCPPGSAPSETRRVIPGPKSGDNREHPARPPDVTSLEFGAALRPTDPFFGEKCGPAGRRLHLTCAVSAWGGTTPIWHQRAATRHPRHPSPAAGQSKVVWWGEGRSDWKPLTRGGRPFKVGRGERCESVGVWWLGCEEAEDGWQGHSCQLCVVKVCGEGGETAYFIVSFRTVSLRSYEETYRDQVCLAHD